MIAQIVALMLTGCDAGAEQAAPPDVGTLASSKASRVEVVVLESTEAKLELDLPGEVGGDQDANLAAANGGFVERVLVKEGEEVKAGQSLAYIDLGLYNAQLEQAKAQLEQADSDLDRVKKLGDLASSAQLQSAQTAQKVAAAAVAQARNRAARAIIRSPFDGVVATVGVERGEAVNPGAAVIRVVQLDPAVINLTVSDRDVVSVVPGLEVTVTSAARSGTFKGVVSQVSPAADMRTRSFPVEVEVPNAERLLMPGMIARVRLERPLVEDAVVVPQDWIVTRRDQRGVFVVNEASAVWREVELGDVIYDKVVINEGLSEGDRVVVTGHRDLVDGDTLIISREGRCCEDGRPTFTTTP
ncbi:MAG: efflux RND transporter periplasmic adaptor subunit [Myxococcales bacterium]|nr:efflux RND transporter periplasmic adaptor subunit [Myxococcales bacterium]